MSAVDEGRSHPFAATFFAGADRVFVEEDGQNWTVGRILSLAADVARAVPADAPEMVAVRSESAAFVAAALVGLWKTGRYPLLLDPALRTDAGALDLISNVAPVLVGARNVEGPADVGIAESRTGQISPVLPSDETVFAAFLTSGSTGAPKLIRKKLYQLARQFAVEPGHLGLHGPVSVLSLVAAHHILGFMYGFCVPASTGGRTVFLRGVTPALWIEEIFRQRPSLVIAVPTHYRLMAKILDKPLPAAVYLSSGAPLSPEVGEAFLRRGGQPIEQVYGSTEGGGVATRVGTGAWKPIPGLKWRISETDGRLEVHAPWQIDPANWTTLDDVVAAAGEGFELVGRADSVVKVAGRRFSTDEISRVVRTHPAVDEAHAVIYQRYGEPAVALFVVPRRPATLTVADLRAFLAGSLAAFKVPRAIRLIDALPMMGIGKIDREALKALCLPDEPDQR
jgi:acyl-coenzyme A synthetase/AMP-(fatty) acid ligase